MVWSRRKRATSRVRLPGRSPRSMARSIFVACNKSSEIVEVDAAKWKVMRRIPARPGVYNLAVTKDGTRLLSH